MKQYILGFILSVLLTLAAFVIVTKNLLNGWDLALVLVGLALIQLWVQLIFFLHLDREKASRWNLTIFLSTAGVVLILVAGSLWIMNNLNYHMPTDAEIIRDEGMQR